MKEKLFVKKGFLFSMICILVLSITVLTGASGPTTMEDKLQLNYANHLVDTDSLKNGNVNPIGKVVVYDQDVNLKPLIAQSTLKYRQKLSDEQIEKRNKVINEYFSLVASGQEKLFTDKFFNILSENHLVFYELGKNKNAGEFEILSTDGSDVSLTTPFIIYNAPLNRWEVWGGFHFSNDSAWWGERPNCGGFCNPDGNIGKSDMLGVYLSGGTNGASLVEMWMQPIHSDAPSPYNGGYDGNYATRINYRSGTYSSELGGMFTAQDAVVAHGLGSDGYAKYSNNFGKGAVKLSYTSSFSGASGNATSAYLHTWSSAEISSISVSTSGVSVSVINASNSTGVLSSLDYAY